MMPASAGDRAYVYINAKERGLSQAAGLAGAELGAGWGAHYRADGRNSSDGVEFVD